MRVSTKFLAAAAVAATPFLLPAAASAAPVMSGSAMNNAPVSAVEQVQFRRGYRGGYHGGWRGGPRYYRHGPSAAGIGLGLATGAIIGSAIASQRAQAVDDAYAYCVQRFKSYDPASGTYLGYDGYRHPCP